MDESDRMSAINPLCPWRGALVYAADLGTDEGDRRAGAYLYSGMTVQGATGTGEGVISKTALSCGLML